MAAPDVVFIVTSFLAATAVVVVVVVVVLMVEGMEIEGIVVPDGGR